MSATTSPSESPIATPIQPLHNPANAAHVVVPQAPLGNVVNQVPGMGAKALLAKKMAKSQPSKPVQLFAQKEENGSDVEVEETETQASALESTEDKMEIDNDDENPF
ncbi:hypothetical protein C8J55DRAFT_488704 [Lentinula edodes]|uniref:Uncharacterized protein n=1 Tax=Lentinula lateritia TaxID=40482 RepID=A0A9W9DQG9_9AGAR|nr:hypothetical protein C8J55DRAFT_488704 [Lentinula edodes]